MRHKKAFRKFSRTPAHRRSMFRNLATSLLEHGSIITTVHKAKDLRRVVEPFITLGGEDTLHNRRKAYSFLKSKEVVQKLFNEIGPKFKERPGGYTRVVRTMTRPGDAAEMAVIQLVEEELALKPKKEKAKTEKKPVAKKAKAEKEVVEEAPGVEEKASEEETEEAK
ncbi:UNVERIFIED_CONTAM: hypothetical protein GTU68_059283 [Idotea baltica]|nr:hypothetical protein [Idotea baltica]